MSFGRHFLPADYVKPCADIGKFYDELIEKEIRSKIEAPDPLLHRITQQVGRRLELGVDAEAVQDQVKSRVQRENTKLKQQVKVTDESSSTVFSYPSHNNINDAQSKYQDAKKEFQIHNSPNKPTPKGHLTLTDVIHGSHTHEGGRFHRPDIVDVYETKFQAGAVDSVYTTYTPKEWPKTTEHPMNSTTMRRLEEDGVPISFASLSSISKRSMTLSEVAKDMSTISEQPSSYLSSTQRVRASTKAEQQLQAKTEQALYRATDQYRVKLMDHVDWLDKANEGQDAKVASTLASVSLHQPTDASNRKRMKLPPSVDDQSCAVSSKTKRSLKSHRRESTSISNGRSHRLLPPLHTNSSDANHRTATGLAGDPADETAIDKTNSSDNAERNERLLQRSISQNSVNSTDSNDLNWDTSSWPSAHASSQAQDDGSTKIGKQSTKSHLSGSLGMSKKSLRSKLSSQARSMTSNYSLHSSAGPSDTFAEQLEELKLTTLHDSLNPFRRRHDYQYHTANTRYMRGKVHKLCPTDSLDYKEDLLMRSVSKYTAVIAPPQGYQATPSRKEVTHTLLQLTRKQILHYHARVVEIGVIVRAMKSMHTHPTPGLEAVFLLHAAFIRVSGVNMNPYILRKNQLFDVMQSQLSSVPESSLSRLLLCFDQTNTGIIRYMRLTCTILAGMDAAILNLSVALEHVSRHHMTDYVHLTIFRAPDSKFRENKSQKEDMSRLHPSGMSQMEPPNPMKYHMKEFHPYKPPKENHRENRNGDQNDYDDDQISVISDLTGQLVAGPDLFQMPSSSVSSVFSGDSQSSLVPSRTSQQQPNPSAATQVSPPPREKNQLGYEKLGEEEWQDIRGELLLLQLFHQFYCECSGFSFDDGHRLQPHTCPHLIAQENSAAKPDKQQKEIPHMRLEDLSELFACCCNNAEDELRMHELILPLQQFLFHRLAQLPAAILSRGIPLPTTTTAANIGEYSFPASVPLSSAVDIQTILKHTELRTLFSTLTISWYELLHAALLHTALLREWIRQVRVFRNAVRESNQALQAKHAGNQTSIGDAIAHFGQEGAHLQLHTT